MTFVQFFPLSRAVSWNVASLQRYEHWMACYFLSVLLPEVSDFFLLFAWQLTTVTPTSLYPRRTKSTESDSALININHVHIETLILFLAVVFFISQVLIYVVMVKENCSRHAVERLFQTNRVNTDPHEDTAPLIEQIVVLCM